MNEIAHVTQKVGLASAMAVVLLLIIYISGLIFTLLPLICAIIQGIFYGTSLFNPSIGIAAITMFALSLIDQNEVLRRTARIETMTGYLNTYGYIEKMHKIIKDKKIDRYTAFYFDIVRFCYSYNFSYARILFKIDIVTNINIVNWHASAKRFAYGTR